MNILMINSVCGIGSTGRICTDLATKIKAEGHDVRVAYGRGVLADKYKEFAVRIGSDLDTKISGIHTRLTDRHGFANWNATKKFLEWATEYDPDVLWLHNIHGYYINVELLFDWIKSRPNMKVRWTLHDCWAFTGHCSYFTYFNCNKWRLNCKGCNHKESYPTSILMNNSQDNFARKKKAFTGVKHMTLITPSKWLGDLVGNSFLNEYPIEVNYNKIDTEIFRPRESSFRKKYNIEDKKMVLGVANIWDGRKGFDDLIALSKMFSDEYVVVAVGVTEEQKKQLPDTMIGITRTNNAIELAEIYTAADVFANPTKEEVLGMVNIESIACGTPVVTYNTGGSPECIDETCGCVVDHGDIYAMRQEILRICSDRPYSKDACISFAHNFAMNK